MTRRKPQSDRAVFAKLLGLAGVVVIAGLVAVAFGAPAPKVVEDAVAEVTERAQPEPVDTRPKALQALEADLSRIGQSLNSHLGIAVVDITSGAAVHYQGDLMMPQQSVSKLWVAMTALDLADSGGLDLSERATVQRENLTLFHQPIRKIVKAQGSFTTSYGDFMRRAMVGSDNTANDMLLNKVGGPSAVRKMLEAKGISGVRFGPGERIMQSELAGLKWDQSYSFGKMFFEMRKTVPHDRRRVIFDAYVADPVDGAQPLAMARALERLAKGELLSASSTTTLETLLRDAKSGPNRLKGGLPAGWQIGHKTGTGQVLDIVPPGVIGEQTGYNDVGILTAPDGSRYGVAVMIGNTNKPVPERMDMMHAVVGAIANYHSAKKR